MDTLLKKIKFELDKLEKNDPNNELHLYGRIEDNHFIPQHSALNFQYWPCSGQVNQSKVLNFYLQDLEKENQKYNLNN